MPSFTGFADQAVILPSIGLLLVVGSVALLGYRLWLAGAIAAAVAGLVAHRG